MTTSRRLVQRPAWDRASDQSAWSSRRPCQQRPHANQVVCGGGERHVPIDDLAAAVAEFPQAANRLHPAEHLLDELAPLLAGRIGRGNCAETPRVSGGSANARTCGESVIGP